MNLNAALCSSLDAIGENFSVDGAPAFVLLPSKKAVTPAPWVVFAPTFQGLLPDASHCWLFSRLLEKGMAIAGIDVGESFGSPKSIEILTALYHHLMQTHPLARRALLLAQSRGALMLYPWAAQHPEKVAAIAGIYPVCDLRQYPGLAAAARTYGIGSDQLESQMHRHNPMDCLTPLAAARIPVFHVHGDADQMVPIEKSSLPLAQAYRQLGGKIELLVIPGKNHEVIPEFFQCQPLCDFIVLHAGKSP